MYHSTYDNDRDFIFTARRFASAMVLRLSVC